MHTFRKLPKHSPRAKIAAARKGSTFAKCPVCLDLDDYKPAGRGILSTKVTVPLRIASGCERGRNGYSCHAAGFVLLGQEDRKHGSGRARCRPPVRPAPYPNRSSVFLHDTARDPQSEAGPGVFLGSVEGFEDLAQMVAGNAAAGVGHGDADSRPA